MPDDSPNNTSTLSENNLKWLVFLAIVVLEITYLHWNWFWSIIRAYAVIALWNKINEERIRKATVSRESDLLPRPSTTPVDDQNQLSTSSQPEQSQEELAVLRVQRRNRIIAATSFSLIAFVAIIAVALYPSISPYWATYRLYEALEQRDIQELDDVVSFDDLRSNLKDRTPNSPVVRALIDEGVTPNNVANLLNSSSPANNDDKGSLLLEALLTVHQDGSNHFVAANLFVFCEYGVQWRVCDIASQ